MCLINIHRNGLNYEKIYLQFIVLISKICIVYFIIRDISLLFIQIRSVYNCFNVHQCALVRPIEFAVRYLTYLCVCVRACARVRAKLAYLFLISQKEKEIH